MQVLHSLSPHQVRLQPLLALIMPVCVIMLMEVLLPLERTRHSGELLALDGYNVLLIAGLHEQMLHMTYIHITLLVTVPLICEMLVLRLLLKQVIMSLELKPGILKQMALVLI